MTRHPWQESAAPIEPLLEQLADPTNDQLHAPDPCSTLSDRESEASVPLSNELSPVDIQQAAQAIRFLSDVRTAFRVKEAWSERDPSDRDPSDAAVNLPVELAGYRIIRSVGRGGFAEVFLAHDDVLDRPVALKVPLVFGGNDDYFRLRFEREGRAAAMLAHPQIVPVYEYGCVGPLPFIAYAWVDGQNLEAWIAEARGSNSALASSSSPAERTRQLREAAEIVAALAVAIEHAHQRGVIHRDLKPSNVLIDQGPHSSGKAVSERVRITDFGLAFQWSTAEARLTSNGAILGTPAYMSPEQAGDSSAVSPATDIWSLGVILVELLTGRNFFQKDSSQETLAAVKQDELPRLRHFDRSIPRDLEAICCKCLQKLPVDRYPGALALADDLKAWLRGESVIARPVSPLTRLRRWTKRNPIIAGLLALTLTVLLVSTAVTTRKWREAEHNLELATREQGRANTNLAGLTTIVDKVLEFWVNAESPDELTEQQRAVLLQVLDTERRLLALNRGDSGLSHATLKSFLRVAEIQARLGQYEEACASCEGGLELVSQNAAAPLPLLFLDETIQLLLLEGEALLSLDQPDAAEQMAERIIKLLRDSSPETTAEQRSLYLARARTLAGRSELQRGAADEAEQQLRLALELLAQSPALECTAEQQLQFASTSSALAAAQYRLTRYVDAYDSAKQAIEVLQRLRAAQEPDQNVVRLLAENHLQAGRILSVISAWPIVAEHLQMAQQILEAELQGEVQRPGLVNLFRQCLLAQAELLFKTERLTEARQKLEQCLAGPAPFKAQALSANITQVRALALSAQLQQSAEDLAGARQTARDALNLAEQVLAPQTNQPDAQLALLGALAIDSSVADPAEACGPERHAAIVALARGIDELTPAREERSWVWQTCLQSLNRRTNFLAKRGQLLEAVQVAGELSGYPSISRATSSRSLETAQAICRLLVRHAEAFAEQPGAREQALEQVMLNLEQPASLRVLTPALLADKRWQPVQATARFQALVARVEALRNEQ